MMEARGWSRILRRGVLRTPALPLGYRATILIVRLLKTFSTCRVYKVPVKAQYCYALEANRDRAAGMTILKQN
jgi:hypothetical protein